MKKVLVIVRHAHRHKPLGGILDNGLSRAGNAQAKRFARAFCRDFGKPPAVLILTSPKVRCRETVAPLERALRIPAETTKALDEGGVGRKTKKFYRWWKNQAPPLVVACTHGDWIPEFFAHASGSELHLKKGGAIQVTKRKSRIDATWTLTD